MKQYYGYDQFVEDTHRLIDCVQEKQIDMILGIARGGLTLAHCMAEGLSLRKVETLRSELYDGEIKRQNIQIVEGCDLGEQKKVLVVDDIADSGETLAYVMEYLKKKYPNVTFMSATLFYKQSSCYEPDFWVHEADAWIEFFWEKDFGAKV